MHTSAGHRLLTNDHDARAGATTAVGRQRWCVGRLLQRRW
jgi:hypothetical protein